MENSLEELQMTGERLLTSVINQNTIEHLHRYSIATEFSKNKSVLDIACGEGYGSMLLAKNSARVVGADISEEAVNHAKNKYIKENLGFIQCSAENIPIECNSIELVISFETIEHVDDHIKMLSEIKRILKEKGILIISSPDKICNTDLKEYENPYHIHELYEKEFKDLINKNFKYVKFLKQRVDLVSIIRDDSFETNLNFFTGDYNEVKQDNQITPSIWIAIASDDKLPDFNATPLFRSDAVTTEIIKTINKADYYKDLLKTYENLRAFKIAMLLIKPIKFVKRIFK